MADGLNFTRPATIEPHAAGRLLEFLGVDDRMVKFAKNGSDVTSAGVKLARRAGKRDMLAAQILLQSYLDAGAPIAEDGLTTNRAGSCE